MNVKGDSQIFTCFLGSFGRLRSKMHQKMMEKWQNFAHL